MVLVWWCTQVDPLGRIRVFDCLATAVASARIILASSKLVQWPFSAHCTRCIRVNWNRMLIFSFLGHQRWTRDEFSNCSSVAGNNLNVPQTNTIFRSRSVIECVLWFISNCWLQKYGHFKFWGIVKFQNSVYLWFTVSLHALIGHANYVLLCANFITVCCVNFM